MSEKKNALLETVPAAGALRKVNGFNPLNFLRQTVSRTGEKVMKLDLPYKKLWFRLACPNGRMLLKPLRVTDQMAIFEARIYADKDDPSPLASFTCTQLAKDIPGGLYIRAAQDEALNEALDNAGFGIQLCDVAQVSDGGGRGSEIPLSKLKAAVHTPAVSTPVQEQSVKTTKRNMIIPHVEDNLDRGGFCMEKVIPHTCPCCGQPTRIHENNGTKTLFCDNPDCETRRLRQFVHFAGQKAMDIEGLSEATLEKFIGRGWLHSNLDIYRLNDHRTDIVNMEGFGEKSWQNLWDAIQRSRDTTFERYLIAMDIPMIGNTASRALAQRFHSSLEEFEDAVCGQFDFTQLPDFGETLHQNIHQWFQNEDNWYLWMELRELVHIAPSAAPETAVTDNPFVGVTIVVTGKVEPYTRSGINAKIESLGAHAGSSVSSKTSYLICGENAGSKLEKARSLGITVLTPAEFFRMAGK